MNLLYPWKNVAMFKKKFAICSLFMWHGGAIQCKVTGSRQYSCDISQGGLEIPCQLIFTGDPKCIQKVKKAMSSAGVKSKVTAMKSTKEVVCSKDEDLIVKKEPAKRVKVNDNGEQAGANANLVLVTLC